MWIYVLCSQLVNLYMLQLFWWCWKRGRDFSNQAIKVMRVSGFVFWMAVKTKYEIFATTHRFNLDLGRNRSVVNGDSDKSWFTDNTGLPNCWNMQKATIKEFYTKERKLSLYTPIEDINVLIKWYIGSDVVKWELGIITECGLVICLLWRAFLWLLTFDILIQLFYKGTYNI